jgi:hypothetical protein
MINARKYDKIMQYLQENPTSGIIELHYSLHSSDDSNIFKFYYSKDLGDECLITNIFD